MNQTPACIRKHTVTRNDHLNVLIEPSYRDVDGHAGMSEAQLRVKKSVSGFWCHSG